MRETEMKHGAFTKAASRGGFVLCLGRASAAGALQQDDQFTVVFEGELEPSPATSDRPELLQYRFHFTGDPMFGAWGSQAVQMSPPANGWSRIRGDHNAFVVYVLPGAPPAEYSVSIDLPDGRHGATSFASTPAGAAQEQPTSGGQPDLSPRGPSETIDSPEADVPSAVQAATLEIAKGSAADAPACTDPVGRAGELESWAARAAQNGLPGWRCVLDAFARHCKTTGAPMVVPVGFQHVQAWEDWARVEGKSPWQLIIDAQRYHETRLGEAMVAPEGLSDLARWEAWAAEKKQPLWSYLIDAQGWATGQSGVPMTIPEVIPPSRWVVWAAEAGMKTQDLLLRVFFADSPTDGPLERAALQETNRHRAANGLSPVSLNRCAVRAARAQAIYDVIHFKSHGHEQIAGTTGYFGRWPPERARYFGAAEPYIGENLHGLRGPRAALQGWMDSPHHRDKLLMAQGPSMPPVGMGYAEATMGKYVNSTMTIGSIRKLPTHGDMAIPGRRLRACAARCLCRTTS